MDKSLQTPQPDITEEPYQGTGRAVSAAGKGAFVHFFTMLIGLIGAGTAAYIFHEPAGKAVGHIKHGLEKWGTSTSTAKSWFAKFINWILDGAEHMVAAVTEHNAIKKRFFNTTDPARIARLKATTDASIIGGGIGYISGFFIGGGQGIATARAGRDQFERAQSEIRDQRAENAALREKYVETKLALEDLKTTADIHKSKLRVAPEHPPTVEEPVHAPTEPPKPESVKLKHPPKPDTATHAHERHGTLDHAHAAEHAPA